MKIVIGADPCGFELKEALKEYMTKEGHEVYDVNPTEKMLYQEIACKVSEKVQSGECERGIGLCGTGMGVSILCNKHKGIYAALCESVYQARRSKTVNNSNVLVMGGFLVGHEMAREMVKAWLEAEHLMGLTDEMKEMVRDEFNQLQIKEAKILESNK